MKRIATALCALAVVMAGSVPALAAEEAPRQDASYYPISVEEYTYGVLDSIPEMNTWASWGAGTRRETS